MKKLSILIVLLVAISLLAVSIYAALAATVTVTASESTVAPGETVTITVSTTAVENCAAGAFMFDYNKDVFEYIEGKSLVSGYTLSGISTANDLLSGFFMGNAQAVEGDLFQITLKVNDDAAYGDYTISGTANLNDEVISCTVTSATITVACNHSYEYTDNGDGTHTATCSACGNTTTEPHTFTDGTCACSATEQCDHVPSDVVIENTVASTLDKIGSYDEVVYCSICNEELSRVTKDALLYPFQSNTMELASQLNLNINTRYDILGFASAAAAKASGYYAVVTRIDENGKPVETIIPASDWAGHSKQRVRIPYNDWNPTQMADIFEVVIYNNNNEAVTEAMVTSIREIAMNEIVQYAALGSYDNYVTLLVDMLNYGAASQGEFGYNIDDLANALLDDWQSYATSELVYPAAIDNSNAACYQTTGLELLSRVDMQLNLWKNSFGVDVTTVKAEISYTNFNGELVTKTVNGTEFKAHTNKNGKPRCKLVLDWLDIPDCLQAVTVVFKDANGNEIATVTESVISALGLYHELLPDKELYPAMIKFINSASAYFA